MTLAGDAEARIGPYRITAEACTCRDFIYLGGWCKHRLAVRMARHLTANGFELPQAAEPETCPQVSEKNLALIASGRVIDDEQRRAGRRSDGSKFSGDGVHESSGEKCEAHAMRRPVGVAVAGLAPATGCAPLKGRRVSASGWA